VIQQRMAEVASTGGFPMAVQMQMHRGQQRNEQDHETEFENYMNTWGEEMDQKAHQVLMELREKFGPGVACGVLKELQSKSEKEGIRNVSSFVFSLAKQRLSGFSMGSMQQPPPMMAAMPPQAMGYPPPVPPPMSMAPPRQEDALFSEWEMACEQWREAPPRAPMRASAPLGREVLQELLERYGMEGKLDDVVLKAMSHAMPERLEEILQEMSAKENVRNPSAWIQKSLKDFPTPRKRGLDMDQAPENSWPAVQPQAPKRQRTAVSSSMNLFEAYPDLMQRMDEAAVSKLLGHPDQNRVMDILAEMEAKQTDIRNPSAFVVRALGAGTWGA